MNPLSFTSHLLPTSYISCLSSVLTLIPLLTMFVLSAFLWPDPASIYTHHLLSFVWLCFSSQWDMGHVSGPIVHMCVCVCVCVCFSPSFFLICFCSNSASSVLSFTLRVFKFLLSYSQTNIRCYLLCIRKPLWMFYILHNLTSRGTQWKWSVS